MLYPLDKDILVSRPLIRRPTILELFLILMASISIANKNKLGETGSPCQTSLNSSKFSDKYPLFPTLHSAF